MYKILQYHSGYLLGRLTFLSSKYPQNSYSPLLKQDIKTMFRKLKLSNVSNINF